MSKRDEFIAEMNRIRAAIENTKSDCLIRDYSKALKRMERELKEYDKFRSGEKKVVVQ